MRHENSLSLSLSGENGGKKHVGRQGIQTAGREAGQMEEVDGAEVRDDRGEQGEIPEGQEELERNFREENSGKEEREALKEDQKEEGKKQSGEEEGIGNAGQMEVGEGEDANANQGEVEEMQESTEEETEEAGGGTGDKEGVGREEVEVAILYVGGDNESE